MEASLLGSSGGSGDIELMPVGGGEAAAEAADPRSRGGSAAVLHRHLLGPDVALQPWAPLAAVRFLKLLAVCALLLGVTRAVVVGLELEHDASYGVDAFLRYDVNECLLDLLFLFVAGGLHAKPAVDELGFVLIAAANAFMMSILNMLPALQVSFSLYEMHCRWTAGTWLFVFIFAAISVAVLAVHVRHLATQPAAAKKAAAQLGVMFILFWAPHLGDGDFHIHHWFYSWFLACQCGFDPWFSRATQAYFLGGYLNGIAVYGRDPILVCEAAVYRAENGRCAFVSQLQHCQVGNHTAAIHEQVADWWGCTGDYHR